MSLWIESASASAGGSVAGTFQTEHQFTALLMNRPGDRRPAGQAISTLVQGGTVRAAVEGLLSAGSDRGRPDLSFSLLRVLNGSAAHVVECDAPPLFLARQGQVVTLPVVEVESHGHLVRECEFDLQDGDHLAIVSDGYWLGWRRVAVSVGRLTDTRCSAAQLLRALTSVPGGSGTAGDSSAVALFVRPLRVVTVWSGPPTRREREREVVGRWRAGPGRRVICGGTTARIAARWLGAGLEVEARPPDGWAHVPPVSQLAGADLVTEGLVTLSQARRLLAAGGDPPARTDGASRLVRLLLEADKIEFLVGLAINPVQAVEGGTRPLRQRVIEGLLHDLRARGKMVSVEYF